MAVATTRAALITTGRARTWRGAVGRQTTIASSSRYTGVSTVHGTAFAYVTYLYSTFRQKFW